MSFGVSAELRDAIEDALDHQDVDSVQDLLEPLHAVDIADLINHLKGRYREPFFQLIKETIEPETLVEVDPALRLELLKLLDITQITRIILHLDSDDALSLLELLDEELVHKVLQRIPAGERSTFERVLQYPDKSAARLMQREIVCVPAHSTLQQVSDIVREQEPLPSFI